MFSKPLFPGLHRAVAVAAIPVMIAELLFPFVPGSTSAKLTLVLLCLTVLANGRFSLSPRWAAHAAVFGVYLLSTMVRSDFVVSSFFIADFQVGLQGLLLAAVLVPLFPDPEERARFFHDVAVCIVAVGALGAAAGVLKLFFQTRGIMFSALEWQGMYPRGTSLRIDYNVFALGLVVALVSAIAVRASSLRTRWQSTLSAIVIPLLFFAVPFTSSRRGVLFLALSVPLILVSVPSGRERRRALRIPLASLAGVGALVSVLLLNGNAPAVQRVTEVLDLARAAERVLAVSAAGQLFETRAPLVADAWHQGTREAGAVETIIGRGDGYLREMGRVFNREVDYEYPHNLLLSALLHGGVLFGIAIFVGVGVAGLGAWQFRYVDRWVLSALVFAVLFALTSASSAYSFDVLVTLVILAGVAVGTPTGSDVAANAWVDDGARS